jgi:hypothetical protein
LTLELSRHELHWNDGLIERIDPGFTFRKGTGQVVLDIVLGSPPRNEKPGKDDQGKSDEAADYRPSDDWYTIVWVRCACAAGLG